MPTLSKRARAALDAKLLSEAAAKGFRRGVAVRLWLSDEPSDPTCAIITELSVHYPSKKTFDWTGRNHAPYVVAKITLDLTVPVSRCKVVTRTPVLAKELKRVYGEVASKRSSIKLIQESLERSEGIMGFLHEVSMAERISV